MHPLRAVSCCLLASIVVSASAQDTPTFRTRTTYVEVDAFVTDSRGVFVRDLTKDDFELLEDGRLQVIEDFRFVDIPVTRAVREPQPRVAADVVTNVGERRVYVLLLEPAASLNATPQRIQNIARQLVDQLLGPHDMMAVVHAQGSTSHAQAFTSSQALVYQSIGEIHRSVLLSGPGVCSPVRLTNSYRAIEELSERLGRINGQRKAIIWFNPQIPFDPGLDCGGNFAAMHRDALRAATRNNVAIYPVNPIPTAVGLADSSHEFKENAALRGVAEDTGGIAVVNTNNFSPAFEAIARDNSTYYLFGYYPSTDWRDGRVHSITVRVKRPGLTVRARRGYYAPEPDSTDPAPAAVAEGLPPEAVRALHSPLPTNGLTMTVFATPFRGPEGTGSVLLGAQIHGAGLRLDADDALVVSHLTIDTRGTITTGPRSTFTLHLRDTTRAAVSASEFRYVERLQLPPGRHEVRLMAHQPGGATGAVVTHVEVPDYARSSLHMSGILLGSAQASVHPVLRSDEALLQVLPSGPTALRRFTRGDTLAAYAEVYTDRRTNPEGLRVTATLTRARGGRVRTDAVTRVGREPSAGAYMASIPLAAVAPGEYVLTIEARAGRRTERRQVPFEVVER